MAEIDLAKADTAELQKILQSVRDQIAALTLHRNAIENELHERNQVAQLEQRTEEFLNSLSPRQRKLLAAKQAAPPADTPPEVPPPAE